MSQTTEFKAKIDSRGSVTIPKAIREVGFYPGVTVRVKLEVIEGPANDQGKNTKEGKQL